MSSILSLLLIILVLIIINGYLRRKRIFRLHRLLNQKVNIEKSEKTEKTEIEVSDIKAKQLFATFSPVLFFNKQEKYYPLNAEWFIQNSKLYVRSRTGKKVKGEWELVNDKPTGENIIINYDKDKEYGLLPDKSVWVGQKDELQRVNCYGNVRLFPKQMIHPELRSRFPLVYELKIAFLYAYNGNVFFIQSYPIGTHTGDIEHITVRIDGNTDTILEVFYAAHSSMEGRWIPSEFFYNTCKEIFYNNHKQNEKSVLKQYNLNSKYKVDRIRRDDYNTDIFLELYKNTQKPMVYPARYSHASYPFKKGWNRFYMMAVDKSYGDGVEWMPNVVNVGTYNTLNDKGAEQYPRWSFFMGKWGDESALRDKDYMRNVGEETRKVAPETQYRSVLQEGIIPKWKNITQITRPMDNINRFSLGSIESGIMRFNFTETQINVLGEKFFLYSNIEDIYKIKIPKGWIWLGSWKIAEGALTDTDGWYDSTLLYPIGKYLQDKGIYGRRERTFMRTAVSKPIYKQIQMESGKRNKDEDIIANETLLQAF